MENPYDGYAKRLNQDIYGSGLRGAYEHFNRDIKSVLSALSPEKENDQWQRYSAALESNGTLPKLAAEFLMEGAKRFDEADGKADGIIHKDALEKAASELSNPVEKTLAARALKQFDTIAADGKDDCVIDMSELANYTSRLDKDSFPSFPPKG